jgi:drug/metabolite transporter (DMT)-like permease
MRKEEAKAAVLGNMTTVRCALILRPHGYNRVRRGHQGCREMDKKAAHVSHQTKSLRLKTLALIAVMVMAGPLGNTLLSKGMKHAGPLTIWPLTFLPHTAYEVLRNGSIWLGIASLLTFFVANLLVLSMADYSFVQVASSVAYGVVALLGYWMLHEQISPLRWSGIAVICVGVLVVGRTNPQTQRQQPQGISAVSGSS